MFESQESYRKFSQNGEGERGNYVVDLYLPKLLIGFDSMQPD